MSPSDTPATPNFLRRVYRRAKLHFLRGLSRRLASEPEWHSLVHSSHTVEANRPISDPRVRIGRHTYGVCPRTVFMARDDDRLTIGNFCSVADGVRFIYGNHPIDLVTTFPLRTILVEKHARNVDATSRGPIVVGNDVWIASNSVVLSGVTIGDGAVIGAGSVVTRDVPPYSLTAGVPARHLRYRFNEEQIADLLKIRWWDWPDGTILDNLEMFYGEVGAFTTRYASRPQAGR